jgi:sugar lactone lactonase YvrE
VELQAGQLGYTTVRLGAIIARSAGVVNDLSDKVGSHRPDDIVNRSDGSICCTDPGGHLSPQERERDFSGVHRIAPDGTLPNATEATEYAHDLACSPDERVLCVAITRRDGRHFEEKARGEVCPH